MKQYIISGIVGAAVIILGIVVITSFVTPINYAPIYLLYLQPIVTQYLVCNKSEIWP